MEIKYLSVAEMVAIEQEADRGGLSYAQMMETAGKNLAISVQQQYDTISDKSVLGLVGSGNNGGDTLVALTYLAGWGWRCRAYLLKARVGDLLVERAKSAGVEVILYETDGELKTLSQLLIQTIVLLDGVLGTGAKLPVRGEIRRVLAQVKALIVDYPNIQVVAVDCPSGIDCDTGNVADESIPAELTITMAAAKQGLFKFPAAAYTGRVKFVGIGLGEQIPYPESWERIKRFVVTEKWVKSHLPKRPSNAHKGSFGTVLVVAGSENYTGAALLAGKAAYRSGAGLVTLAIPRSLHFALAGHLPEATWLALPEMQGVIDKAAARIVLENMTRVTSLLVGPGFGLAAPVEGFIEKLFASPVRSSIPALTLDADGLKLLARLPNWPERIPASSVLTPHPGEMAILTGERIENLQLNRVENAEKYACRWGHVVILKGAFSVIAAPDGRVGIIPVATSALARAGTGDVLAGLVTGLRAQGVQAFEAACAGAWLHAQAGITAAQEMGGSQSVLAGDVLNCLPRIFQSINQT
jgi:NAD(P)H-hydrate epimerase